MLSFDRLLFAIQWFVFDKDNRQSLNNELHAVIEDFLLSLWLSLWRRATILYWRNINTHAPTLIDSWIISELKPNTLHRRLGYSNAANRAQWWQPCLSRSIMPASVRYHTRKGFNGSLACSPQWKTRKTTILLLFVICRIWSHCSHSDVVFEAAHIYKNNYYSLPKSVQ